MQRFGSLNISSEIVKKNDNNNEKQPIIDTAGLIETTGSNYFGFLPLQMASNSIVFVNSCIHFVSAVRHFKLSVSSGCGPLRNPAKPAAAVMA